MFFLLCCSLLNLHILIIHVFNRFFMLYVVKIGYVNKIDLRYNLVYFMFFKCMYISVSTTVCPFSPLLHLSLCPYVLAESGSSSFLSSLFFLVCCSGWPSSSSSSSCSSELPTAELGPQCLHGWSSAVSATATIVGKKIKWITHKIEQIWPEQVASLLMGFCCIFKPLHL